MSEALHRPRLFARVNLNWQSAFGPIAERVDLLFWA